MNTRLFVSALGLLGLSVPSAAQVFTTIAQDSFDYPAGANLGGQAGGSGFLVPWFSGNAAMDATITQPGFDAVGNRATTVPQVVNPTEIKSESFRRLDGTGFDAITEISDSPSGFVFGTDGAVMWVSFTAQRIAGGDDTFGGFSLFQHFGTAGGEKLYIGSPFVFFEWGIDDGVGNVTTVAGSSVDAKTRLVCRVDFLPGSERVRLYLDPAVPHPTGPAGVDVMVPDFRFNEIRFASGDGGNGGNVGGYHFDDIVVECQDCLTVPPPSFVGTPMQVSLGSGGTQTQTLDAGVANAGLIYLVLGSASGTTPGFLLGSGKLLPLNVDSFTLFTLTSPNSAALQSTFGVLDASGQGGSAIVIPPGLNPALAGLQLNFAYVLIQVTPSSVKLPFASVAVPLDLVP